MDKEDKEEWSCYACTFLNNAQNNSCEICSSNRVVTNSSTDQSRSSGSVKSKHESVLFSVGSSPDAEGKRLRRKIQQLRDLGIELPGNDLIALLAKNCYSVQAAANRFFESGTNDDTNSQIDFGGDYLNDFTDHSFRLVGKKTIEAFASRSGVKLRRHDKMLVRYENSCKKKRPRLNLESGGVIRIVTEFDKQIGRFPKLIEDQYSCLMKHNLIKFVAISCSEYPRLEVFSNFQILVFIYVNIEAFSIFNEEHDLFHISEKLYDFMNWADEQNPSSGGNDIASKQTVELKSLLTHNPRSAGGSLEKEISASLPSLIKCIELKPHQIQGLEWMIIRESNADKASIDMNPIWKKKQFLDTSESVSNSHYYLNAVEKTVSLCIPENTYNLLGGILADDMGMGKTITSLALVAYSKIFKKSPGKTLVVCPLSLLYQWESEICQHIQKDVLSVNVYYGEQREAGIFENSDVILTTYGVLLQEYDKTPGEGRLMTEYWDRVILDEAHCIKNRSTNYFKSCAQLQAKHRWCLSGTPIQNSLEDVFSLICFLRYQPWSRFSWWKRSILSSSLQDDEYALQRLQSILAPILLRRTKLTLSADGSKLLDIPSKVVKTVRLEFSKDEGLFYKELHDFSRSEFRGYLSEGSTKNNYIAIFTLLLRLRQACGHPSLVIKGENASNILSYFGTSFDQYSSEYFKSLSLQLKNSEATYSPIPSSDSSTWKACSSYVRSVIAQIEDEGLDCQECPICLDCPDNPILTQCAHLMCASCLPQTESKILCPICRSSIGVNQVFHLKPHINESERVVDNFYFKSTKIHQLLKDMEEIKNSGIADGKRKVVVFSQWIGMLKLVSDILKTNGYKCCYYDGSLPREARKRVIYQFSEDPDVDVLVISLKAGGVGLNLTAASVVILLDPWWNPGVEQQAIDRVHRLGQTKEVIVKKYIVQNTVETMILKLQERKAKLARNVLLSESSNKLQAGISMEDLIEIFEK